MTPARAFLMFFSFVSGKSLIDAISSHSGNYLILYLHVARFSALVLHRHSPFVYPDRVWVAWEDSRLMLTQGVRTPRVLHFG